METTPWPRLILIAVASTLAVASPFPSSRHWNS